MSEETTKFNPSNYLTKLKGKDYLEVKWRLLWISEDCKEKNWGYSLESTPHSITDDFAVFKTEAVIWELESGKILKQSTGWGSQAKKNFSDFIEKAETKSKGRVLADMGYGTQFAVDVDEGDDQVVDAPVIKGKAPWSKE